MFDPELESYDSITPAGFLVRIWPDEWFIQSRDDNYEYASSGESESDAMCRYDGT